MLCRAAGARKMEERSPHIPSRRRCRSDCLISAVPHQSWPHETLAHDTPPVQDWCGIRECAFSPHSLEPEVEGDPTREAGALSGISSWGRRDALALSYNPYNPKKNRRKCHGPTTPWCGSLAPQPFWKRTHLRAILIQERAVGFSLRGCPRGLKPAARLNRYLCPFSLRPAWWRCSGR